MQAAERVERSSRVTTKGQVTIPAEIRRALGVGPRDRVAFVLDGNVVRLQRAESVTDRTAGALKGYFPRPPLSAEEERARFEEGVAEEAIERSNSK